MVAAGSVALIWMTTRSAIKAMAEAAGKALRNLDGAVPASAQPAVPPFVTEAQASLRYDPETEVLRLERRFMGGEGPDGVESAIDELVEALTDTGVSPLSIGTPDFGNAPAVAIPVILSGIDGRAVAETGLSLGFREDRGASRKALKLAEFQELVGKIAIDMAVGNIKLLQEELGIEGSFALLSAELNTVSQGSPETDTVIKARLLWRPAPQPAVPAED